MESAKERRPVCSGTALEIFLVDEIFEPTALQPLQLGLFRSDYIVHKPSADAEIGIKQVEFNTIASSFGALAQQTAGLHKSENITFLRIM